MNRIERLIHTALQATIPPVTPRGLTDWLGQHGLSVVATASVPEWRPLTDAFDGDGSFWIGEGKQRVLAWTDRKMIPGGLVWRRCYSDTIITWRPTHYMPAPRPPGEGT